MVHNQQILLRLYERKKIFYNFFGGFNLKELLEVIAKGLVKNPDEVSVFADEPNEENVIVYHLNVAEEDMGRVIGKQGRIAKALRTVVKAAATKNNKKVTVEIMRE